GEPHDVPGRDLQQPGGRTRRRGWRGSRMTYQGATFNNNGGFNNFGPNATFHGPISVGGAAPAGEPGRAEARAEVGVLTVLDTEMRAVDGVLRRMYDYRERRL